MFWPSSLQFWGLSPGAACLFPPLRASRAARGLRAFSPGEVCLFPPRRASRVARGLRAFSPGAACLFPPRRAARAARGLVPSPRARRAFSLRDERPGQPEACRAPSLRGPSARHRSGLRKSLDRNRGLFAGWEGVASLGLFSPLPSPCLLPPVGMGRLFSGVSQSLCFANRRRCVPPGQFFSRSPTV